MRHKVTIMRRLTTALVLMMLLGGVALAQHGPGNDRQLLAQALEKTDMVIERAKEVVIESGSERARNQLEMAVRLQTRARNLVNSGTVTDVMAITAGKYTLNARERAQRAIALTRQADANEGYVRRELEKTDNMLARVNEQVSMDTPEQALMLLDSIHEKQQRATELFHNGRLKMSLQMTLQARKALEKLIEDVGGYMELRRRYNALGDRYFTLRDRIQLSASQNDPDVRIQLDQAERNRERADDIAAEGRLEAAVNTLQSAVEQLAELSEEIREPARIEQTYQAIRRQAELLTEKVQLSGNTRIERLYRAALDHLDRAEEAYRAGDHQKATVQLQAARQTVDRVSDLLGE